MSFVVAFFTLLLPSCSNDDIKTEVDNKKLPDAVQKDVDQRFIKSEVKYFSKDSTLLFITLFDENNNEANLQYKDNLYQAENRVIANWEDLPQSVKTAFDSLSINGISDLTIYRTQRLYLKHDLYTFVFLQNTDKAKNLQYSIFINEDGTVLYNINNTTNDNWYFYPNFLEEFDYVEKHYTNADVRCQINELGYPCLIIKHDNYLKFVSFKDDPETYNHTSWKETRYKLPIDYPVPANVMSSLQKQFPDFTYTEITKIETSTDNSFLFVDGTRDDKLGHGIPDQNK